jgi:hypothetical protein
MLFEPDVIEVVWLSISVLATAIVVVVIIVTAATTVAACRAARPRWWSKLVSMKARTRSCGRNAYGSHHALDTDTHLEPPPNFPA